MLQIIVLGADGEPSGIRVTLFVVPGKVALYLEDKSAGDNFGLDYVLEHATTRDQQDRCLRALTFKTELPWAQLDALHHAYVTPGLIPPGAFVPADRGATEYHR